MFLVLTFCSDEGDVPYRKEYFFPDKNIGFYEHVQPLIDAKCGFGSGCHNSENSWNFLFYTTTDNFINYVIQGTGNVLVDRVQHKEVPIISPLYLLITEGYPPAIERMPPLSYNREPLTSGEIEGIRKWISEGAKD
jgi:hypothetical protein